MAVTSNESATVVTGEHIEIFRIIALRSALGLECMGMRRSGRAASVIARETLGSTTRNKRALYAELDAYCVSLGANSRPLNR